MTDTSINISKHGYSSKYLKSDSNIADVFTLVKHRRDTITNFISHYIPKQCNNRLT